MKNLITQEKLTQFKDAGTRVVRCSDGTSRTVRMPPNYWEVFDALKVLEGFNETDIARYAEEEVSLQDITFEEAFRACVVHFANRWTP